MSKQTEAQRLAHRLTPKGYYGFDAALHCPQAAAELLRQEALIAELTAERDAAMADAERLRNGLEHIAGSCAGRAVEVARAALDAARSARPAARKVQPLTDEQIDRMHCTSEVYEYHPGGVREFVRDIERAHGITGDSHE